MNGSKNTTASIVTLGILAVATAPVGQQNLRLGMRLAVQLSLRNKPSGWRTSYINRANISASGIATRRPGTLRANEAFVAIPANSDATAKN